MEDYDQVETESITSSGSSGNYSYVESSQSPSNSSQNISPIEEEREYDSVPEEETIRVIEPYPGSYCLSSHSELPVVNRGSEWNSQPSKGILASNGDNEFQQWSIESFFDDPDKFIHEMNKTADLCKGQREHFILHSVLPHLEKSWGKCSSKNEEVFKILVQIGCSANSRVVIRHALLLFLHLICQEDFDSGNISLLVVEEIARSSIFMPDGVLKKSQHSETSLQAFVYSRILSWLLIQRARDVDLSFVAVEQDLKKIQHELEKSCNLVSGRKKDLYRYSMEFISKAISQFRSMPDANLKTLIEECHMFCENSTLESGKLGILCKVKKNNCGEWVDLHCVLIHLHGKVQSERPVPQMETERRALKLIRLIVEAYVVGRSKADWKFCLLVSSLLADTAKNSVTKELRVEAGGCLVYLLNSEKLRKRPECRELLERKCKEVLFCPDKETREFLVRALYHNSTGGDRDLQRRERLPVEQLTEHLSSSYRTNSLEIKKQIISDSPFSFVKSGMFRSKKIAIKFLHVTKQDLREKDLKDQAREVRERLNREVMNMRQLNASRHPNFPVLLAYDTKRLPYHIITAFEERGDLLAFVRSFREGDPPVKHYRLLEMLKDVSDAILYLQELGLVHRAVMAKNVLVGSQNCKLTGLHSTCRAFYTATDSVEGYCSAEVPDVPETDLPVRWKAPECLTKHQLTTASDVWAFGVLVYEVLTYGCTPYRDILDKDVLDHVLRRKKIVPSESCFENEEYELIRQSCAWEINKRLKISQVSERLQEMSRRAKKSGKEGLRHHPPPLEMQCTGDSSSDEQIYDSIPEKSDELRMPVQESNGVSEEYLVMPVQESKDVYGELEVDDYVVRKNVQGLTKIWEKLSEEEDKHIRALNHLKNDHLFSEYEIEYFDSLPWMSWECPNGNLKEYVLDHRCNVEDIVMFLSQVASALHYLHVNHIVHGDLRAEHVNVVATDKVQVGRLGRSKSLSMSEYEVTSTSCVKGAKMPPDALRWSAPQVILDGQYTHASDVWAFGILAWELYTSFAVGQQKRQFSVPYHELKTQEEILQYMADVGPLGQPDCCPDWVYKIIHQCWAYDSTQRPPFLAIVDCLTSREPMKSWMMQLWLQNHSESEWPDLSISQDGAHVLNEGRHPSKQDIERMCSEDYFAKHNYRYNNSRLSEKDKTLYSSVYANPIYLTVDKTSSNKKMGQNNIVPYDVPGERKHVIGEVNQNRGPHEESRNKASGMDLQDCTIQDKATKNLSKDNKAPKMEHGDCFIDDKPISNGGQRRENQDTLVLRQNVQNSDLQSSTPQKEQDKCSLYDKPTSNPTATESKNREYQNALALQESPNEALENKTLTNKRNRPTNLLGDKDENRQYQNVPALRGSKNGCLQNTALKREQGGCYRHDMPEHGGENREYQNVQALRHVHRTDDLQRKPTKMDPVGDCFVNSEYPTNTDVTDDGRKDQDYENVLAQRQVLQNGAPKKKEKGQTAPAGRLTPRKRKYGNEENIQRTSTSAENQPKENEYAYENEQATLEGRHLSMEDGHSNRMSASHDKKIEFEYYV